MWILSNYVVTLGSKTIYTSHRFCQAESPSSIESHTIHFNQKRPKHHQPPPFIYYIRLLHYRERESVLTSNQPTAPIVSIFIQPTTVCLIASRHLICLNSLWLNSSILVQQRTTLLYCWVTWEIYVSIYDDKRMNSGGVGLVERKIWQFLIPGLKRRRNGSGAAATTSS